MRTRRPFRPVLETMSSRIAPSSLLPYDNPVLAPVMIIDEPPPFVGPLAPVMLPIYAADTPFVGDGSPPAFGLPTPPLHA